MCVCVVVCMRVAGRRVGPLEAKRRFPLKGLKSRIPAVPTFSLCSGCALISLWIWSSVHSPTAVYNDSRKIAPNQCKSSLSSDIYFKG